MRATIMVLTLILTPAVVSAQQQPAPTTRPATEQPLTQQQLQQRSAEEMLRQMLRPSTQAAQPLRPIPDEPVPVDATSGGGAVIPNATTQPLTREGTMLLDRVGRLTRGADGKSFEFTLDSDGPSLSDPPLVLLPNRRLSQLEDLFNNSYRDITIRVSGEVTEYRGRNYLLLQRWGAVPDVAQPLQ